MNMLADLRTRLGTHAIAPHLGLALGLAACSLGPALLPPRARPRLLGLLSGSTVALYRLAGVLRLPRRVFCVYRRWLRRSRLIWRRLSSWGLWDCCQMCISGWGNCASGRLTACGDLSTAAGVSDCAGTAAVGSAFGAGAAWASAPVVTASMRYVRLSCRQCAQTTRGGRHAYMVV